MQTLRILAGRRDKLRPGDLLGALTGVAISRPDFERAMTELYRLKGWNPETAAPTRERLAALEIEWVADLLGLA